MTIYPGKGGHLFVRFKNKLAPNGKFTVMSLGTKNRAMAEQKAKDARIAEMEHMASINALSSTVFSLLTSGSRNLTIASCMKEFELWMRNSVRRSEATIIRTRSSVLSWARTNGLTEANPATIDESHISPHINRTDKKWCAGHRHQMLADLKAFFSYLALKGHRSGNPAALVAVDLSLLTHEQIEPKERLPFTDSEVMLVLLRANPFWRVATLIGRHTALRLGDIACLQWANVTNEEIQRWTLKQDKRVTIPVHEQILAALATVEKEHEIWVFPSQRASYLDPNSRGLLSVQFGRLARKCGIVGKTFHNLRHTRATELAATEGIEAARRQLGHSHISTTKGYVHATPNQTTSGPDPTDVNQAPTGEQGLREVTA